MLLVSIHYSSSIGGCIGGQNNRAIVLENNGLLFSRTMEVNLDLLNGGMSIVMLIKGSKIKGNYIQWIEDHIVMLINRSKIKGNNIQWIKDQSSQGQSSKHSRVNQAMTIEINSLNPNKNSVVHTPSKNPIFNGGIICKRYL